MKKGYILNNFIFKKISNVKFVVYKPLDFTTAPIVVKPASCSSPEWAKTHADVK